MSWMLRPEGRRASGTIQVPDEKKAQVMEGGFRDGGKGLGQKNPPR